MKTIELDAAKELAANWQAACQLRRQALQHFADRGSKTAVARIKQLNESEETIADRLATLITDLETLTR